ncbi:hypothetical protein M3191_13130 [Sporosarcina luteola]|nr:hypothetical protein [Sporosarcina luteola]MCM3711472.1 hypothetical protein [Sporosarcina luteola]
MISEMKLLYDNWNKNQLQLDDHEDFILITTPFLDYTTIFSNWYLRKMAEVDINYPMMDMSYPSLGCWGSIFSVRRNVRVFLT